MNYSNRVYQHSGIIGPAIYTVPILGFIGTIILSLAYSFINVYSPITGYISVLLMVGFGAGIGFVISWAGYWGKCRNPLFLKVAAFAFGLLGLYTSWVVFLFALIQKSTTSSTYPSLLEIFMAPGKVWELIKSINATGWYSLSMTTPSGTLLWVMWGIEAIIILVMPVVLSKIAISRAIFCERCYQWSSKKETFDVAVPQDEPQFASLIRGDISTLEKLERVSHQLYPHIEVELHSCPNCTEAAAFRLKMGILKVDSKGNQKIENTRISNFILLSNSDFLRLKGLAAQAPKEEAPGEANGNPEPAAATTAHRK